MFEDLEEENVDVTPDSPDRAIAWAIASRGEAGSITAEEGWAILHERYPDDARFLLVNTYAEISEAKKQATGAKAATEVVTASFVLGRVTRIEAADPDGAFEPQVRELVTFASAVLAGAKGDDVKAVSALRDKLGIEGESKRDDRDRAGLKLRRFEREILKDIDERTEGGKPLGVAKQAAPGGPRGTPAANDWASATADKSKSRRKYGADQRFEPGELVDHVKFGVGVVTGTEPGKAVILFESGVRKLVAGA